MPSYRFRPATRADLPMLASWLAESHVARWWGDPAREAVDMAEGLHEPRMTMLIGALVDGPDIAYLQHYDVMSWPQGHFTDFPAGWRAVDMFIGPEDQLRQGHGSKLLRQLAEQLLADGAAGVLIDPAAENDVARAAYAKAGFTLHTVAKTHAGDIAVMRYVAGISS